MLVCAVSLQVPRTIAAEIAETAAALAAATGHIVETYADIVETLDATAATAAEGIVFAALVDDPASATETVIGYVGENMEEAASATDTFSTVQTYSAAIDETLTATDAPDAAVAGAAPTRSAMVDGVFLNTGTSREANANGVMINL